MLFKCMASFYLVYLMCFIKSGVVCGVVLHTVAVEQGLRFHHSSFISFCYSHSHAHIETCAHDKHIQVCTIIHTNSSILHRSRKTHIHICMYIFCLLFLQNPCISPVLRVHSHLHPLTHTQLHLCL